MTFPVLSWVACEMRTGKVIAELPDLTSDALKVTMGRYESAGAALPIPTAPENWERVAKEGASWFVLLADDEPLWGGYCVEPVRSEGDTVELSLATAEAYLARRFVGDKTYTATGQNSIVADLIASFVADTDGIPMTVVASGDDTARDREYYDAENKTVLATIQELSGVIGGPEFTVTWQHLTSPERYVPVLRVGALGSAPNAGMDPAVTFSMPGPVVKFSQRRSYADGFGANAVVASASSSGTGTAPRSPLQTVTDTDRPRFEYRWVPSSSITDVDTLTAHAGRALASMASGAVTTALEVDYLSGPRLVTDWGVGDVVGYQIGGLDSDGRDTVPAFPGGVQGRARVVGWSLDLTDTPTVTPTLVEV